MKTPRREGLRTDEREDTNPPSVLPIHSAFRFVFLFLLSPCRSAPSRFVSAFSTPSFLFRFLPSFFFPATPPATNVIPSSASCASGTCSGTVPGGAAAAWVEWQQQGQQQRRPADGLSSSLRSSRPPMSWTCGSGRRHPRGVAVMRGWEGESAGVSRADWVWEGAEDGTTDCDTPRISESAAVSDNASCFEARNFARWL